MKQSSLKKGNLLKGSEYKVNKAHCQGGFCISKHFNVTDHQDCPKPKHRSNPMPSFMKWVFVLICSFTVYFSTIVSTKAEPVQRLRTNLIEEDVVEEEVIPFQIVEVKPLFQNGNPDKFSSWINAQIVYPEAARNAGIKGRVKIQFTINTDGSVSNIKVLHGIDPSLDNEAIRVVSMSPKWTPGKQGGKAVRVSYTCQVNFKLK